MGRDYGAGHPAIFIRASDFDDNTRQFEDRIVKNADVREFTTPDGNTPFLYAFLDSSKLVSPVTRQRFPRSSHGLNNRHSYGRISAWIKKTSNACGKA